MWMDVSLYVLALQQTGDLSRDRLQLPLDPELG